MRRNYVLESAVPVTGASLKHQGFEVLLGRDVLEDCLLFYDGPAQSVTLSF